MIFRIFKKTGCGITTNSDDDNLIQIQWFRGQQNLRSCEVIEVQPLPLYVSQSEETNPYNDQVIESFVDVMLDSTVNRGGEENFDYYDGGRVDDDFYSIAEALAGTYF